jgi:hypothetical protein
MAAGKKRYHDPSQDTRPIELHLAQLQIMLGETLKLSGEGRFAKRRQNPTQDPLELTTEGTQLLHALEEEIRRLTTQPTENPLTFAQRRDYTNQPETVQSQKESTMIATEEVTPAAHALLINSPLIYHKLFCFVCEREWISDAVGRGETFKLPQMCRYSDCRSPNWSHPVKGPLQRQRRLARQQMQEISDAEEEP